MSVHTHSKHHQHAIAQSIVASILIVTHVAGEPQLMLTAGPAAMGMGVVPPVQPGYAAAPGFGAMPAGPMPPAGMPAGMPAYGYSM